MKVSVVLPIRDEEQRLEPLITELGGRVRRRAVADGPARECDA